MNSDFDMAHVYGLWNDYVLICSFYVIAFNFANFTKIERLYHIAAIGTILKLVGK